MFDSQEISPQSNSQYYAMWRKTTSNTPPSTVSRYGCLGFYIETLGLRHTKTKDTANGLCSVLIITRGGGYHAIHSGSRCRSHPSECHPAGGKVCAVL